jgi:hypothetical protein
MPRQFFVLAFENDRRKAMEALKNAPVNSRVDIKDPKRSLPQNDHFHAILTEISSQLIWHGQKWSMEDWKRNLLACFKRDLRMMPSADGKGIQIVGGTSDLSKDEARDFIEFLYAFGAEQGVEFKERKAT